MNRPAMLAGLLLVLAGLSIFYWKAERLGLPLAPSGAEGLWRVEMDVDVRGIGRRGSVTVPLPTSEEGQLVFDERSSPDRLDFDIRTVDGARTGVFTGLIDGVHHLSVGFRAELRGVTNALPRGAVDPPPPALLDAYGRPSAGLPSHDDEVQRLLERLRLPGPQDPAGRLRALYSFVTDQVALAPTASDDPLLTLASREGSRHGQARLLVTLLRAAGLPAREVLALRLTPGAAPQALPYVETWVDGEWVSASPAEGFFANRPRDVLVLRRDSLEELEVTGATGVGHSYYALRERLRPDELAALMTPPNPVLERLSLYRLPLGTQNALRGLLLMPLGALIVALFRNLIGVPTFGTFMPVLIAFALRGASLGTGLMLAGLVLSIGIGGRFALERLRLLMVPRLGVLLCAVVLAAAGLALVGRDTRPTDFSTAVLFPIVILTMLVERVTIAIAEEGLRNAMVSVLWSVVVTVTVYPIFRSDIAEHLMFSFPELIFTVMGVLVWIGAYTGYRASDLLRFRSFAEPVLVEQLAAAGAAPAGYATATAGSDAPAEGSAPGAAAPAREPEG